MNSGQEWTTGRGGPHGPGRAGIPSPARSAHRVRVNIAAPGLAGTERGRPGAGVPRTGLAPRSGPASLVTVVRSLLPVIRLLLARPAGEGAVGAEPAGDAEAHLKDRERGERRGVDVEVACADAVADDGAYRPFVVALPLAHPGPGRLGQAGGVPVGDQRLAAMGGVPWVMFLSGDEKAKPVVAQLIRDAGFDPFDLGGIDDSRLQDSSSALWINILTHDEATALVARVKSGDTAAAEQSAPRTRARELAAPFERLRDHAPDDPAFFLEHLTRSVFEAGISWRVVEAKWDGIREAFHGFDPAQVAAMPPAEIAAVENDSRVIRNKAKIRATVQNAREILAILDQYGRIRGYLASFPDAGAAATDMRRRFKFLGDTGVWRLLTSASRDIG